MDNIIYRLWLGNAVDPTVANRLIKIYKNAENIYNRTDYKEAGFLRSASLKKLADKNITFALTAKEKCDLLGIKLLTPESYEFPPGLKNLPDCPVVLYAKGIIPEWSNIIPVAVVGTRNLSPAGIAYTKTIAGGLADMGACIVSGFARGADSIAHESALNSSGFTIGVLGSGVDVVYPKSNSKLYTRLLKNGLFLSEYPPGMMPTPYSFPRRNRIIAGISNCMVVTEAPEKSGAIISAQYSKDYERPVFANPDGAPSLLDDIAKPAYCAEDILNIPKPAKKPEPKPEIDQIICALSEGDIGIDELCTKLGISVTECNSRCFLLELEGKIIKLPGNIYHKS